MPSNHPITANGDITVLLRQWNHGEASVADEIAPYIYKELHSLAGFYLRKERGNHTLKPTALVSALSCTDESCRASVYSRWSPLKMAAATVRRSTRIEIRLPCG